MEKNEINQIEQIFRLEVLVFLDPVSQRINVGSWAIFVSLKNRKSMYKITYCLNYLTNIERYFHFHL